jgi:hypothetical protein
VNDYLRIGFRPKLTAALFQLCAQLFEIVNLAVESNPNGFFGVGHRLMAAGQIDNGKSPDTEGDSLGDEIPFIVRATVNDRRGHSPDRVRIDWVAPDEIKLASYTAHGCKGKPFLMTKLE